MIGERYSVLDQGWVELLFVAGDERAMVKMGRRGKSSGDEADKKFIFDRMSEGHLGMFEFVEFTFRVHCPVVVAWQWKRYRTWSYYFSSGRYNEFGPDAFYKPPAERVAASFNTQTVDRSSAKRLAEVFDARLDKHYAQCYEEYEYWLDCGMDRELARIVLPGWSCYYTFFGKIDARNLMHFLSQRLDGRAQWEIRQYAGVLAQIFAEVLPWTGEAFMKQRGVEEER